MPAADDSDPYRRLAGRFSGRRPCGVASGAGEPVARTKDFQGALENVDVQGVPGVGHLSIDKNEIMQQRVITAIDAVVFSRRKEISVVQKPPPNASAAAASSSARN